MHCPGDVFYIVYFCRSLHCWLFVLVELGERGSFLCVCVCARPSVTVDFIFVHACDQMSREAASVFKLRPVALL